MHRPNVQRAEERLRIARDEADVERAAARHRAGLAEAHATAISTTVFLEGTVSDPAEKQQAFDIARAIWGQIGTGRLETR